MTTLIIVVLLCIILGILGFIFRLTSLIVLIWVGILLLIVTLLISEPKIKKEYVIDLPEEISLADANDTLIAIKRNDTIFIQFNNK